MKTISKVNEMFVGVNKFSDSDFVNTDYVKGILDALEWVTEYNADNKLLKLEEILHKQFKDKNGKLRGQNE